MKVSIPRIAVPALLAATIPATVLLAQAPPQAPQPPQAQERQGRGERMSPEVRARLRDGRIAMIKESLRLDEAQLKLWTPVEQQLRASHAAREQARQERRQRRAERREGASTATPSLADRLERRSRRMTERAQRMAAFSSAFKPFYESLNGEQKQVAVLVMRELGAGRRGYGHRWAMHREGGDRWEPRQEQPEREQPKQ
jgi:hypothetical protein